MLSYPPEMSFPCLLVGQTPPYTSKGNLEASRKHSCSHSKPVVTSVQGSHVTLKSCFNVVALLLLLLGAGNVIFAIVLLPELVGVQHL